MIYMWHFAYSIFKNTFSNSLIIHAAPPNQSILFWTIRWMSLETQWKMSWKHGRVWNPISNTDANFLNLHIDKATKTCGDKQLLLFNHTLYETNLHGRLHVAMLLRWFLLRKTLQYKVPIRLKHHHTLLMEDMLWGHEAWTCRKNSFPCATWKSSVAGIKFCSHNWYEFLHHKATHVLPPSTLCAPTYILSQ